MMRMMMMRVKKKMLSGSILKQDLPNLCLYVVWSPSMLTTLFAVPEVLPRIPIFYRGLLSLQENKAVETIINLISL